MPTTKRNKEELLGQPAQTTTQQNAPVQSSTVQQAQSALQQANNSGYQSKWQTKINDMLGQYMNREKFSYDVNEDALFQQLKEQYAMMGQQAMMDTMGQASALTGGYGNSYAQGVGQQAYQGYIQQLTDRVPDFYQMALNQYLNEGSQIRDNISMLMQQENVDYGQYRDLVGDQQWKDTFDYGKARDEIADQQWRETFDYSKSRDQLADQQNAYSKLMALMTGYGYKPSEAEMKAAGMSKTQRDAILKLGAYAPVYYEEEEPRKGAYVLQTGLEEPPNDDDPDPIDWITYSDVAAEVEQLKQAGATRQDINDHINDRVNSSNYKPNVNAEQDTKDLKTVKRK